uniref:Uncharacterized protein n=1 Tax=Anguilla anguilla TaxID=7936 RepID=A0A0E9UJC1_ANGAN
MLSVFLFQWMAQWRCCVFGFVLVFYVQFLCSCLCEGSSWHNALYVYGGVFPGSTLLISV